MARPTAAPEQPVPGTGAPGWRQAVLVPIIVMSAAALVWMVPHVWQFERRLSAAGAHPTFVLPLAFNSAEAERIIQRWQAPEIMPLVEQALRADWVLLGIYTVYLLSNGLLFTWLLRFESRSFAPVLICYPICAALFAIAENLCVQAMLAGMAAQPPRRPAGIYVALAGVTSSAKFILLAESLVAALWALFRLPRRARGVDTRVEEFRTVYATERRYLAERRALAGLVPKAETPETLRPVGLALSGGGIRSATFNLGVLQSLARLGILLRMDYLSTVSGGGYIGSCLSSLLSHRRGRHGGTPRTGREAYVYRQGDTPYFGTTQPLFPFNPDATAQPALREFNGRDEVRHLRTHGDFIITRRWILSREVLRAVGNLLGGIFYHLLIFTLFLVAFTGIYWGTVLLMTGSTLANIVQLPPAGYVLALLDWPLSGGVARWALFWSVAIGAVVTFTSFFVAGLVPYVLPERVFYVEGQSVEESREYSSLWAMFIVSLLTATFVTWHYVARTGPRLSYLLLPLGVYVGGQATALLLHPFVSISKRFMRNDRSRFAAAKGIFNYLTAISLVVVWIPYLAYWVYGAGFSLRTIGSWLGSVVAARFLVMIKGASAAVPATSWMGRLTSLSVGLRNALLAVCVAVILLGGVVLVCAALIALTPPGAAPVLLAFAVGSAALGFFGALGVALDFNSLSLHYFYRDRLAETYLQTFVPRADARRVGFQVPMRDDAEMPLTHVHGVAHGEEAAGLPAVTASPLHLVVTALNLTSSRDMARRDRKSDYFVFSRLHCGSETTGYMDSARYRSGETKLARAMTISGAAASSAMGSRTFLAQSFALTLLNVRLGQWIENPRYKDGRYAHRTEGGVFWPHYLLREILGATNANRRLVNLSDGGHTGDNLGICPLLKRRCAIIVACDAEADPTHSFGSLTEALRQIYIDENVVVDIDLDELRLDAATGRTRSHHALGVIHYPRVVDATGREIYPPETGYLVVLKSSLVGNEPATVLNYRQENADFPHQTTGDQFFDDDQFESYRALGEAVAFTTFGKMAEGAWNTGARDWERFWGTRP
ncbi:MAG TPA: patatin-like phospholipase family protein [Methylomirabilota bacterium]|nr:patatin-like phospholipase family protein [Methylomirabilota bacterium]